MNRNNARRKRKTEDRLALRLALEDVKDARVWDGKEMDDFRSCLTMCQDFVSVLYADGGVGTISMEEAEKLVAEQHPVPLEIQRPEDKRESEQGNEEAQ